MTRWRVRFSSKTTTWDYCSTTRFLDADTAENAAAYVEADAPSGTTRSVFDVQPATVDMEEAHNDRQRRISEWIALAKTASAYRGLL